MMVAPAIEYKQAGIKRVCCILHRHTGLVLNTPGYLQRVDQFLAAVHALFSACPCVAYLSIHSHIYLWQATTTCNSNFSQHAPHAYSHASGSEQNNRHEIKLLWLLCLYRAIFCSPYSWRIIVNHLGLFSS